ncbi:hypothetical protein Y032_0131g1653 [Ancylostoma ceylanicum]|uniref:Uncharacterized protein n=1 Tax=Ancylostoma ceylanicum TaxID=53326 RepID=A0A016T7A4_9BILA|nr:hypothetical protein Y032_0131g1653 [Ancylostoma ceylanicum]
MRLSTIWVMVRNTVRIIDSSMIMLTTGILAFSEWDVHLAIFCTNRVRNALYTVCTEDVNHDCPAAPTSTRRGRVLWMLDVASRQQALLEAPRCSGHELVIRFIP